MARSSIGMVLKQISLLELAIARSLIVDRLGTGMGGTGSCRIFSNHTSNYHIGHFFMVCTLSNKFYISATPPCASSRPPFRRDVQNEQSQYRSSWKGLLVSRRSSALSAQVSYLGTRGPLPARPIVNEGLSKGYRDHVRGAAVWPI